MSIKNNSNGRIWLGAILIVVGVLIFLKNFHYHFLNINIFSWPVILLVIGIIILVNHKESFFGIVLVVVGGAGIASRYFHISFKSFFSEYWPFLIIIFGIYLVLRRNSNGANYHQDYIESKEYYLDIFSIFGDRTKKIKTDNFLGGKSTSLFSSLKIDLRDAKIIDGVKELDTLTMFGATEIFLPNDWEVKIKTTTIFGGFEDHRGKSNSIEENVNKILIIKGLVLFGGGEIKG